ncbi:MAG: hypothetical protein V2A73_01000 [Pseudomonadota bacterium]
MAENQPKLAEELAKMKEEPLLPVEKKLIVFSIVLGILLLVVLAVASKLLFPT